MNLLTYKVLNYQAFGRQWIDWHIVLTFVNKLTQINSAKKKELEMQRMTAEWREFFCVYLN